MRMRVLLILSLMAGPGWAQVYKCETDAGTVYGDMPCGEAMPLPELPKKAKPAQGLRPGEKQRLRSVEAKEAAALRAQEKQRRAEERVAQRRAEQDEKRCRTAKRQLAGAEEDLRRGYKAGQEEKLQRKLREYREDTALYCG